MTSRGRRGKDGRVKGKNIGARRGAREGRPVGAPGLQGEGPVKVGQAGCTRVWRCGGLARRSLVWSRCCARGRARSGATRSRSVKPSQGGARLLRGIGEFVLEALGMRRGAGLAKVLRLGFATAALQGQAGAGREGKTGSNSRSNAPRSVPSRSRSRCSPCPFIRSNPVYPVWFSGPILCQWHTSALSRCAKLAQMAHFPCPRTQWNSSKPLLFRLFQVFPRMALFLQ